MRLASSLVFTSRGLSICTPVFCYGSVAVACCSVAPVMPAIRGHGTGRPRRSYMTGAWRGHALPRPTWIREPAAGMRPASRGEPGPATRRWPRPTPAAAVAWARLPAPDPSGVAIGLAGLGHQRVVLLEDLDDLGRTRAGLGDLVPEFQGLGRARGPLGVGDGGQLHLPPLDPQLRLAAQVPVLAVVVGAVHAQFEQGLEVLGHFGPLVRVGEVGADPGAGYVVGEEVLGHVGPADGVVLGDARPGDAVQLAGLHRHLDVFPGQGHRDHAETGEEFTGRGKGENAFALEVGQALDRLRSEEHTSELQSQ